MALNDQRYGSKNFLLINSVDQKADSVCRSVAYGSLLFASPPPKIS